MRLIIIGDVHGCFDELEHLLNKIHFNRNTDYIYFTGDYFDRGQQSYEVFQFLKELKTIMGDRCHLVYGNHEDMLVHNPRYWNWNGKEATVKSFKDHNIELSEVADWVLANTKKYFESEHFDICHAGRVSEVISDETDNILLWDRDSLEFNTWRGKLTFVGHTPMLFPMYGGQPNNYYYYGFDYLIPNKGLICIDTGCVFGNTLSACIIENGKMVFFDSKLSVHKNDFVDSKVYP